MKTQPIDYIFHVKYTCPKCEAFQYGIGTIACILSTISELGWPICPECGDDMDESVIK